MHLAAPPSSLFDFTETSVRLPRNPHIELMGGITRGVVFYRWSLLEQWLLLVANPKGIAFCDLDVPSALLAFVRVVVRASSQQPLGFREVASGINVWRHDERRVGLSIVALDFDRGMGIRCAVSPKRMLV
ncbi:hypothetical protein LMG24238_06698 [Paraburkholderia sediminicola]|uniref:Uncharacterized protein n=1 Tax=Paraburkholderia sediminicola TaxID=458836 RepID=A0A6J5CQ48_9BURK|nr:hypothetical protein [Paraburkholderia sediminicola]CAB3740961.1 hypothetical protein LMG24238_06698 [Paraburkholderia sediminicola]